MNNTLKYLHNCPNCAGTLNEAGRCIYCGSKIYDFLSINLSNQEAPSDKTYIRIKIGDDIVVAPFVLNRATITQTSNRVYAERDGIKMMCVDLPQDINIDLSLKIVDSKYKVLKGD